MSIVRWIDKQNSRIRQWVAANILNHKEQSVSDKLNPNIVNETYEAYKRGEIVFHNNFEFTIACIMAEAMSRYNEPGFTPQEFLEKVLRHEKDI